MSERIGGPAEYIKNAPDPLYRIDGAWFVCYDQPFIFKTGDCNVLSFGINHDPSFDIEMVYNHKCLVHSFDPIVESGIFADERKKLGLTNAATLNIESNWFFHRIGIVGEGLKENNIKIGSMMTLDDILEYTKLKNKVGFNYFNILSNYSVVFNTDWLFFYFR